MLIPFFYLKMGKIEVLQVQNTHILIDRNINIGDEYITLRSVIEPELSGSTLFINGTKRNASYRMLKLYGKGEKFIKAINILNEGQSNV